MIIDCIKRKISTGVLYEGQYGIEIETETKKPYPVPLMAFWDVKDDNSLRDYGKEYVLKAPVNYGVQLDEALNEFYDKTKKINFIPDSISTSVHVHWNILPETWQTFGNFLTIYTLTENLLIEYSGEFRRNNLFCLPIRSVPILVDYIVNIFSGARERNYNACSIPQEMVKYAALNLSTISKFGSLEMRSMRGVTDVKIIKEWISIINSIVNFSRQDLTPPKILDIYKELGDEMIADIFGKYYDVLSHKDSKELLRKNLFRAGKIGYCLTEDQWKMLDTKPEKKEVSKDTLEMYALQHFGISYADLSMAKKEHIHEMIAILEPAPKAMKNKQFYPDFIDFVAVQGGVANINVNG